MPNPARAAEASSLLARLADQSEAPKYIRAYHGSPYDFDRFDASKIGSGEGHQAYGYGHYFAQAEPTADTYRKSVTALQRTPKEDAVEFWRRHAEISGNKQKAVFDALSDAEERLEEVAGIPSAEKRWKEIVQHLYELDFRQPVPKRPGHMYEVEIGQPEEAMLDYDALLGQQSPYVKERLARLDRWAPHIMRPAREVGIGQSVVEAIRNSYPRSPSAGFKVLSDAGIPGVRYLDQFSRDAGAGTRNYVVFPGAEDSIRILRKYAVPGAIGTGAAAMQEQ